MIDVAFLLVSLSGMIFSAAAQAQKIDNASVKLFFMTTWLLSGMGAIMAMLNLYRG